MPQGKGTYGSKVGRPPKKKKYQTGGSIDPFSTRNPEGIPAKMDMEAIEEQDNLPTSNAMERSEVSPMGAEVGTGVYNEGGKVKDVPFLKSDNPEIQKMYDEGRKRYVKKQNEIRKWEKHRPKKGKSLAAPPKSKKPKKKKKSMGKA